MQVLDDNNNKYELRGRVAGIVSWLVANQGRLMRPGSVQIVFDCAGSKVSVEMKERERLDLALLR